MNKYRIKTLMLSLLSLIATSCAEDAYYQYLSLVPYHLEINDGSNYVSSNRKGEYVFEATNAAAQILRIHSMNIPWKIENPASWVKLYGDSGTDDANVAIQVTDNETFESRAAILAFVSLANDFPIRREIVVTQYGQTPSINPVEKAITMAGGASSKDVKVESNVSQWTATTTYDWITATRSGDKVHIAVDENTGSERIGYVTVAHQQTMATIKVTQQEAGVTLVGAMNKFSVDGGTQTFTFNAEASWTASTTYSWIDIKKTSGNAGENTVTVEVLRNTSRDERNGNLYIYIGGKGKQSVDVSQSGVDIAALTTQIDFDSYGGKQTFMVQANTAWRLVPSQDWITVTPTEGRSGTTSVEVTVGDAGGSSPRNGKIDICLPDGTTPMSTVNIKQEGWHVDDLVTLPDFPRTQSTQTVDIVTTGVWEARATEAWIHVSPVSGAGNGRLSITVDENFGDGVREGFVKVKVGDIEKVLAVRQLGIYVNVSCDEAVKTSTPCSVKVTIGANTSWTASTDVEWMTVSPESGTGDAEMTVLFADNPSSRSRKGNLIVACGDNKRSLSFTQPGRYLRLSASSLAFAKEGGTSELVTVETDGKYSVSASDDWFTVTTTANGFTVTAKANGDNNRTGTVTVSLTDLEVGDALAQVLYIRQKGKDTTVDIDPWNNDEDWNVGNGEDKPGHNDPSDVDKDGYDDDEDWNPKGQ